ncbi:unnamed protein product [Arabis nemorensis]|uniref:AGC-kinase C-terminal domain-containing protein n=1 Tax=Arabis nemorensis TaxID=586526 RepID=A0A565AW77_9BRAS|nr:unnamed protein product [Arabis nemorensis]
MHLFFFTASEEGENKSSSSSLVANLDMTIPSTVDYYYTRSSDTWDMIRLMINTKQCALVSRCDHDDVQHKVLTLGGGDIKNLSWRQIEDNNNTGPYVPSTKGICINGIVYYGATRPNFDKVRSF